MTLLGLAFTLIFEACLGVYNDIQYPPQNVGTVQLQAPIDGGK